MPAHLVYITAPNRETARAIGRALVEERLAACANLLGEMTSIYRWDGKLHEDPEIALLVKTREDLVAPLIARVRQLHPYECPCIVSWPIAAGNPAFLDWIATETDRSAEGCE